MPSPATTSTPTTITAPAIAAGLRRSRWNAAPHTEVPRVSAAASVVAWVAPASTGASACSTACSVGPPPGLAPYAGTATPGMREIRPTHVPGPGEVAGYPLGLDRFGGDVLSKLIWGAQASLLIGVVSTAFGLAGGMLLGLLAGTFGGWVDSVVMLGSEITSSSTSRK